MAIIESIPIKGDNLKCYKDAEISRSYRRQSDLKSVVNPRIQLVSGKDVSKTYQNDHDGSVHSCMKGDDGQFYDQMKNLRMIRVISDDNDGENKFIVHLRALVWKVVRLSNNETYWYIDRVYSAETWASEEFNKYWKKWGKLRYGTKLGTLVAKIKKGKVPFAETDSFSAYNLTRREIINQELDDIIPGSWRDNSKEIPPTWRLADKMANVYD